MLLADRTEQLDELLGLSIAEFDIPDALYARVIARYEHVAAALAEHWPEGAGLIYPQGSIRLGTVTAPIDREGEYDLDFVCRRDLLRVSITTRALKLDVGKGLNSYVLLGPDGSPILGEGSRCWTLEYPGEPFHMDVLPAIPDDTPEATSTSILITDREQEKWLNSDPIAFADWFQDTMRAELIQLEEAVVAKRMEIEQAPPSARKTMLQRAVQALKRHRDMYFQGATEDAPASIIITTLAARAYSPGGSLHEVLGNISARMPDLVERIDGRWVIANPVASKENFADRWAGRPGRAQKFFDWIEQAHIDFEGFGSELGIDRVVTKLSESFGGDPIQKAAKRLGVGYLDEREQGRLRFATSTGILSGAGELPVKGHDFYGDADAS